MDRINSLKIMFVSRQLRKPILQAMCNEFNAKWGNDMSAVNGFFPKSPELWSALSGVVMGAALSPTNAFHLIQGLETLPLRFREHQRNAAQLADYLAQHEAVSSVIYPQLFTGTEKSLADKYLKTGQGALIGIELKGGADAGRKFIDHLKLIYHVANIGDARTLAIHPASTTHSQLSAEDQLSAGVTPGYVRLSVGIEHIEDIITDIEQALAAV